MNEDKHKVVDDSDMEDVLEEMSKGTWKPSLRYRWVRWYQYTWMGELWFKIKRGIPALWRWRKVAWNDVDWDYSSIYDVLIFKINNMANAIEKYNSFVGVEHEVSWMRRCANLFEKVREDHYGLEHMDYREIKMDFIDLNNGTGASEVKLETVKENVADFFEKYPTWHKRAIQHIKDNQHRYRPDHIDKEFVSSIMAQLRQEKARQLAFQIMEWRVERWWD